RSAGARWRRDGAAEDEGGGLILSASLRGAKRRSSPAFRIAAPWIASRSLSSGAHSRDPLARNDVSSELAQQRVAAGNLDLAGRRLEIELLDHAVIHQHRIAMRADAEPVAGGVQLHADRLGEFGVAVGKENG